MRRTLRGPAPDDTMKKTSRRYDVESRFGVSDHGGHDVDDDNDWKMLLTCVKDSSIWRFGETGLRHAPRSALDTVLVSMNIPREELLHICHTRTTETNWIYFTTPRGSIRNENWYY